MTDYIDFDDLPDMITPGRLVREVMPLTKEQKRTFDLRTAQIEAVLTEDSLEFLVIGGPCSADDLNPLEIFLDRSARLQEKVEHVIVLVPRVYTGKPRTTGKGYKGAMIHPKPGQPADLDQGIMLSRQMHLKALDYKLGSADEMLNPENMFYVRDALCYHAVGARTTGGQLHREAASDLKVGTGMKNPLSGNISVMLNAIEAAQSPQDFTLRGKEIHSDGNPLAHGILRGWEDLFGENHPNYHRENLVRIINSYRNHEKGSLKNPALIIDTNHSQSGKRWYEQPDIALEIMCNRNRYEEIGKMVKGLMIEAYLHDGKHEGSPGQVPYTPGLSWTDPCLGWDKYERLVMKVAELHSKLM